MACSDCSTNCSGDCSSVCSSSCSTTCSAGCSATCESNCSTSCSTDCSNGCSSICSSNCSTICSSGCTDGCSSACSSNCSTTCSSGCSDGCSATCASNCSTTCSLDCSLGCSATCASNCSTLNDDGVVVVADSGTSDGDDTIQLSTFIDYIKQVEELDKNYMAEYYSITGDVDNDRILGFLRSERYNDTNWKLFAGYVDEDFVSYVKSEDIALWNVLDPIMSNEEKVYFNGEEVDIIHTLATADAYLLTSGGHNAWAGWAGDLATGTAEAQSYSYNFPSDVPASTSADYIIGNNNYTCGMVDIESDADGVKIASLINSATTVSEVLTEYYYTKDYYENRYTYLGEDIYSGFTSSTTAATLAIYIEFMMTSIVDGTGYGIYEQLAPNATSDMKIACNNRLAEIIVNNV